MHQVFRFSIFFAATGALIALTHWFIYRRFFKRIASPSIRRFGMAFTLVLAVSIVPIRILRQLRLDFGESVTRIWWIWIGFAFYLMLATVGLDGIRWLIQAARRRRHSTSVPLDRRQFLITAAAGGAVAISGSVSIFGAWTAYHRPNVTEVPIKIPKLPKALDGFTILQLSDLHIGPAVTDSMMRELVIQCRSLRPDLVAVTGDLVDSSVKQIGSVARRLLDIKPAWGTHFVTGNHDYYANHLAWCEALQKMGFNVLRNARTTVGDHAASFDLAGVDDWSSRHGGFSSGYNLDAALVNRDPDRGCILLAHQPANFDLVAERGVDLQLSGHTHGGQMFPLTALIGLRWPYSAGLYVHQQGRLYVSRGVGFVGPPMRVGSPPEIVKIVLVA